MATTKKSTKAKTKTSTAKARTSAAAQAKRTATKSTKAAKTVKKTVTSKTTKSASVNKTSSAKVVRKAGALQRLHLISVLITLGLAVAVTLLMNNSAYQLVTGLLTKDELASQTTTVFAPAVHSVFDIELRWAVVAILGIATLMSLLFTSRLRRQYEAGIQNKASLWRWIDTAVVGALMIEVVALLSGIQDIATLKLMGGMVAIGSLLGWVAERQNANVDRPVRSAYILGVVAGLLPWLVIGTYCVSTYMYGMVRNSWYVYALYAVGLISFIAYTLNTRSQIRRSRIGLDYQNVERNYVLINLLTRIAFAAVLIAGLQK